MIPPDTLHIQSDSDQVHLAENQLVVMSLNLAHGRKDGINQILLDKETINRNLAAIAEVIMRTDPDIVALQEADGPSRWSGNFDHVVTLADSAGYPVILRTNHARSVLFSYGTALLSKTAFHDVIHHTFKPSPPTMNKGFTLGEFRWKRDIGPGETVSIDIVSVHLDFSRKSVREQQIAELKEVLAKRNNPMIILGDFNSDWFSDEKVVRTLAEGSGLQVYQPEADGLGTYSSNGRRLDWILISQELEFQSYEVLPDLISDHLVILATIRMKD